jgi:hypothetical protein
MNNINMFKRYEKHYPNVSTIELLNMLDSLRRIRYSDYDYETDTHINIIKTTKIINALKRELSKREHIPNKKERNIIRKNKYNEKKFK